MPELTADMRVITQPGAYWATQDIAHFDGGYGLTIAASNVTVNFNGHYFGSNGPVAIYSGGQHDVLIEAGHVWGNSSYGIRVEGYVSNNRVSSMEVYGQRVVGISVEGYGHTIVDNNDVHDIHAADRAYGIISQGNGNIIAYNDVSALVGGHEAVHYSDTGTNHQVYGNDFDAARSGDDVYLAWLYGFSDNLNNNTFRGDCGHSDVFGIYQGSDQIETDNSVYDITKDAFYFDQYNSAFNHDHFFWSV